MRWVLGIAADGARREPRGRAPPADRPRAIGRPHHRPLRERRRRPAGLLAAGPDMAGGSVFDDFNGDGLPDLFWTSYETDSGRPAVPQQRRRHLPRRLDRRRPRRPGSRGRTAPMPISTTTGISMSCSLRGGWENPAPMSLLRNLGGGRFEDVTEARRPRASRSPASRPPGRTSTATATSTCSSAASPAAAASTADRCSSTPTPSPATSAPGSAASTATRATAPLPT